MILPVLTKEKQKSQTIEEVECVAKEENGEKKKICKRVWTTTGSSKSETV